MTALVLLGAPVLRQGMAWDDGPLVLRRGRVAAGRPPAGARVVDLRSAGLVCLPGLVNGHDHLDFGGFPLLARGAPYADHVVWTDDVTAWRATGALASHESRPLAARLLEAALRNLGSGVTSVAHMNPLVRRVMHRPGFPLRILGGGRFFHSVPFGGDLRGFLRRNRGRRFMVHAAEGTSPRARDEILALDAAGGLGPHTLVVHGTALDEDGARLMARRGATLVACPASNLALYGAIPDLLLLHARGVPLGLGSDSPISGPGDLLADLALARRSGLDETACWAAVTTVPADASGARSLGRLAAGSPADVVLADAADPELRRGRQSVVAVLLAGKPILSRRAGILEALGGREASHGPGLWLDAGLARWCRRRGAALDGGATRAPAVRSAG